MAATIGIIGAGAMGSGVARRLRGHGARVLTPLDGRSGAARARALDAGMEPADMAALAGTDLVLSIVPPAQAVAAAERFAATGPAGRAIYADCNALDVRTVQRVEAVVRPTSLAFADGGIIGLPPVDGTPGPTVYLSGPGATAAGAILSGLGVQVQVMDGPVGAASALKMSYAGITKGLAALASMMVLGADRAGAGAALRAELAASQGQLLDRFQGSLPGMVPKAYRWVAEMREIAAFLDADPAGAAVFEGIAQFYQRIADDAAGDRAEVAVIEAFARSAAPP